MSMEETLQALLAAAGRSAHECERAAARGEARIAWVNKIVAALQQANRRVADAWNRVFDALPDDLSDEEMEEIPDPPEQAELDAIHAQIAAARDHDRWPRELYWGDI